MLFDAIVGFSFLTDSFSSLTKDTINGYIENYPVAMSNQISNLIDAYRTGTFEQQGQLPKARSEDQEDFATNNGSGIRGAAMGEHLGLTRQGSLGRTRARSGPFCSLLRWNSESEEDDSRAEA
mgnify:CR=1 FL=1